MRDERALCKSVGRVFNESTEDRTRRRRSWAAFLSVLALAACGAQDGARAPSSVGREQTQVEPQAPTPQGKVSARSPAPPPSGVAAPAKNSTSLGPADVAAPVAAEATAEPMDRATACQTVSDAICKAHMQCNKGTTRKHPSGRTVHVVPDEITFQKYEDCMSSMKCGAGASRPLHAAVAKPDVAECLDAVRVGSKDEIACNTYTSDQYPSACLLFFYQADAKDYALAHTSSRCAPGYLRQKDECLASCKTDQDCSALNELCGTAGTCEAAQRCTSDSNCPAQQVCGQRRNSSGNRTCERRP